MDKPIHQHDGLDLWFLTCGTRSPAKRSTAKKSDDKPAARKKKADAGRSGHVTCCTERSTRALGYHLSADRPMLSFSSHSSLHAFCSADDSDSKPARKPAGKAAAAPAGKAKEEGRKRSRVVYAEAQTSEEVCGGAAG
jgi:hypothetical protein